MPQRVLAVFLALAATVSCNDTVTGLEPPSDPTKETFAPSLGVNIATMTLFSGVYYSDIVAGTGVADTANTDSVKVNYSGFLKTAFKFDSGTAVTFSVAQVVNGFRIGMVGMKEGGKRKIVIPSELGYGNASRRGIDGQILIPRQSTLVFDIELLKVYNPVAATGSAAPRAGDKP